MNKSIRLLIEGFFDDEIFNIENDIKSDIEDIGRYYDYKVGDIYYQNDKPYAMCCGDKSYFKNNKFRFCLLNDSDNPLKWSAENKLVKELDCFKFKYFDLISINDFLHIDEDGYGNTQIIKNKYKYKLFEFPAFKYCINLDNNIYLPAIDELLMMYLNKDKLGKYSFRGINYWSSTLYSASDACIIDTLHGYVGYFAKYILHVRPFFHLD